MCTPPLLSAVSVMMLLKQYQSWCAWIQIVSNPGGWNITTSFLCSFSPGSQCYDSLVCSCSGTSWSLVVLLPCQALNWLSYLFCLPVYLFVHFLWLWNGQGCLCSQRLHMAVCKSVQAIPDSTFCSRFIETCDNDCMSNVCEHYSERPAVVLFVYNYVYLHDQTEGSDSWSTAVFMYSPPILLGCEDPPRLIPCDRATCV